MSDTSVIDLDEGQDADDIDDVDEDTDEQEPATAPHPDGPRWGVNLHMRIDEQDAANPLEAAQRMLAAMVTHGLSNFTYSVTDRHSDDDDPVVFVRNGRVYTGPELDEALDAEEDEAVGGGD